MTIFGSDVSHFDAPDTRAMFDQGIVFQTHKAGGDANDGELSSWWRLVAPYRDRVLLGAYWVLYPNTPVARAEAFLARLDSQCPGWRDGPFILQVDCEKWNGNSATVPNKADIKAFCDRLVYRAPKLMPIVYAPKWVYGNTLDGLGYPLWASAYVNGAGGFKSLYPGDTSGKWGAYSGQVPAILQYSSSATIGGQSTCDVNAFRGTLDELIALLAPGWIEDDVTPGLSDDDKVWIADQLKGLVTHTAFADGGGQHSPTGDAVLNGTYPRSPGATRTYVWQNLQAIHTALAGLAASIAALAAKDQVDEEAIVSGVVAGILAGLPADHDDVTVEELTAAIRALIIPAPSV